MNGNGYNGYPSYPANYNGYQTPGKPASGSFDVPIWVLVIVFFFPMIGWFIVGGLVAAKDQKAWTVLLVSLLPTLIQIVATIAVIAAISGNIARYF